jgi:hypothetical protein
VNPPSIKNLCFGARLPIRLEVFRLFKNVQIQGDRNPEE